MLTIQEILADANTTYQSSDNDIGDPKIAIIVILSVVAAATLACCCILCWFIYQFRHPMG